MDDTTKANTDTTGGHHPMTSLPPGNGEMLTASQLREIGLLFVHSVEDGKDIGKCPSCGGEALRFWNRRPGVPGDIVFQCPCGATAGLIAKALGIDPHCLVGNAGKVWPPTKPGSNGDGPEVPFDRDAFLAKHTIEPWLYMETPRAVLDWAKAEGEKKTQAGEQWESGVLSAVLSRFLDLVAASVRDPIELGNLLREGKPLFGYGMEEGRQAVALRRKAMRGTDAPPPPPTPEEIAVLREAARPILEAEDPLLLVRAEYPRIGYGGDAWPAIITYLAATSRLVQIRKWAMPMHLMILGDPSVGKSWPILLTLDLLPPDAYVRIDAGSPRALIYSPERFRHRALIYWEADSIPAGEDDPVASAFRSLLAEGCLTYDVTIKDPASGRFVTQHIRKEGPTVLLTTGTRRLGPQMDARVFTLEAPEGTARVRAALAKQAELEVDPPTETDPALIAFQAYLQALAPWDVLVPFDKLLAKLMGANPMAESRMTRDHARLVALIKAIAIVRHVHRDRDADGRLVATLADYATAWELVNPMFEAATTRASVRMRETVKAVKKMKAANSDPVTVTRLAAELGVSMYTASKRVEEALPKKLLSNRGGIGRKGYDLDLGDEPLPPEAGLPEPKELALPPHIPPETGLTFKHSPQECLGSDEPNNRLRTPLTIEELENSGGNAECLNVRSESGDTRGAEGEIVRPPVRSSENALSSEPGTPSDKVPRTPVE